MALWNKSADRPQRSALAQGAAKLESFARDLKIKQGGGKRGTPFVPERTTSMSPDELWAKQFMSQGIGPCSDMSVACQLPPANTKFPMQSVPPGLAAKATQSHTTVGSTNSEPRSAAGSGPMGAAIGKPMQKRSWLGRMLLGR
jgi:hypothetical protein